MGKDSSIFEDKCNDFIVKLVNEEGFITEKKYNNPWKNDDNRKNLINFFRSHKNSKFILIGEAPGDRGCLQCGVPFCDDYTLPKLMEKVFLKKDKKMDEKSAQKVFETFGDNFISWNAFPYQPSKENGKNRNPPQA